eukprot:7924345-Karenia_brevis.AAC.1
MAETWVKPRSHTGVYEECSVTVSFARSGRKVLAARWDLLQRGHLNVQGRWAMAVNAGRNRLG